MIAPENPHAFPLTGCQLGMTLRDYFAGQALAGHMAKYEGLPMHSVVAASVFYGIADAMLAERAKGGEA